MRIVYLCGWYAEQMGYSENKLPKALAELGHDVHVVTSDLRLYPWSPDYAQTYEPFIGPARTAAGTFPHDGFTLHRLPSRRHPLFTRYSVFCGPSESRIVGLGTLLRQLRPAVIQLNDIGVYAYQTAWWDRQAGAKLFLEFHKHASVMGSALAHRDSLAWRAFRQILGRWLTGHLVRCYPISDDAAEVAQVLYGIPRALMTVRPLGVDTALFQPPASAAAQARRVALRQQLGFADNEVVAIYTGRFTDAKGPQILADAVARLRQQGHPVRALFMGGGTTEIVARLSATDGCVVHAFVAANDLVDYYWAADLGVWPRQESTSQLDALACGLPIVISDQVQTRERVDGCGLMYHEPDAASLAEALLTLLPAARRAELGLAGSKTVATHFSWLALARRYVADYEAALRTTS